jgi:prepilin-type N-terminal cleavage/methylation domain-containing protein
MTRNRRAGFTLLEILIVIAIAAMIAAIAIIYSGAGRNQVSLSVESAKIADTILEAKHLAVATYSGGTNRVCAYGVYFNIPSSTYSLFAYNPGGGSGPCPSVAQTSSSTFNPQTDIQEYSPGTWQIHVAQGLVIQKDTNNCTSAVVVLFYPPNPTTLISQDGTTFVNQQSYVDLASADGAATEVIAITPAGQVNF